MKQFVLGFLIGILPFSSYFGYIKRGHFTVGAELIIFLVALALGCYIYADYKRSKPRYKFKIIRGVGYEQF